MENKLATKKRIGEIIKLITKGTTPPKGKGFVDSGINYIKSDAVTYERNLDKSKFVQIDEETHLKFKRSQLEENDILYSMAGIYLGKNAIVPKDVLPANTNQALAIIRLNQEIANPQYVSLYLSQDSMIDYVNNMSGQSAQPNINFEEIKSIEIQLPPLPEQKAIASVLSSLDDKIDLLHQQNQTLEALAETLFRQWFIEEAKEDWEEVKLGDFVDIFNGVSYKSDDLNPSTTAMVTLKSFNRNGGFRTDGFKEYTGKFKETHIVKEGDLVVAHTDITQDAALIGNPILVMSDEKYEQLVISMDLVKVVSKVDFMTNDFLYLLMKSREFKEHALGYSNGSTVLHLSKKAIPEFEFKLPKEDILNKFRKIISPTINKQFENQKQIQTLTKLRDTLLPKLMSGEVRVKN